MSWKNNKNLWTKKGGGDYIQIEKEKVYTVRFRRYKGGASTLEGAKKLGIDYAKGHLEGKMLVAKNEVDYCQRLLNELEINTLIDELET